LSVAEPPPLLTTYDGPKGRDWRAALALRVLLAGGGERSSRRFCVVWRGAGEDSRSMRAMTTAGADIGGVPRSTFRAWIARGWIAETCHQTRFGLVWVVTEQGKEALRG